MSSKPMNPAALFFKGMAMGAADVVPGVSGGTIAFITNIYDELINSIHSIGPKTLLILKNEGVIKAWHSINGNFLFVLFAGIATSILSLAKLITILLATQPVLVWAFFFGLIVVSGVYVGRQVSRWTPAVVVALVAGTAFAWSVAGMTPSDITPTPLLIFGSGALAICAMILPGISGSFILLMLGMYSTVLTAVTEFNIHVIALFGAGAVIGLLLFSRVLNWLLTNVRDLTLAVLCGFMLGSLNKVWPWKETLSYRTNSHGHEVPFIQQNVSPFTYSELLNVPSQLLPAIGLALAAVALVVSLEWIGKQNSLNK